MTTSSLPSYLVAGDTHSILNGDESNQNTSFLDSATDLVTKFVPLSIASGVNQLYNIIPTVGNWLGGDFEQSNFKQAVQEYDDDLSKYYTEHQLGTDAVGFLASSLIPVMAGVKVLNAGQKVLGTAISAGKFGTNTGRALGLLAPSREKYISQAIRSIGESGNAFALTETNTLKALMAGFGQNALEGAAFTTMVNATMYKSPVLDGRDASDLTLDVAVGGLFGGVVGGVFSGIRTSYKIAKAGAAAERSMLPWAAAEVPVKNATESDKILFRVNQLANMPEVPVGHPLFDRATRTAKATREALNLEIREGFQNLAGGDRDIAQCLFTQAKSLDLDSNFNNLLGSTSASRATTVSGLEKQLRKVNEKLKTQGMDSLTPEESKLFSETEVAWVKLRGDGMGSHSPERPAILTLADRMKSGDKVELTQDGIKFGNTHYRNVNDPHQAFNILNKDHYSVEARYAWAERLPKWEDTFAEPIMVHVDDIPLLRKAVNDGLERIAIIPESRLINEKTILNGKDAIREAYHQAQNSVATKMATGAHVAITPEIVEDKLRNLFGINFNLVDDPMGVKSTAGPAYGWWTRIAGKVGLLNVKGDVIAMERSQMTRKLGEVVATLKHEEGHMRFQALLDARGVTRENMEARLPGILAEAREISKKARPAHWKVKDAGTQEYLNRPHELMADSFGWLSRHPEALRKYPEFNAFAGHLVSPISPKALDEMVLRISKPTQEEIAKIVNMHPDTLSGVNLADDAGRDARALAQKEYNKLLKDSGTRAGEAATDVHMIPSWIKVTTSKPVGVNGNLVDGMAYLGAKTKLYEQSATRTATQILGEELPEMRMADLLTGKDVGSKFLQSENSNYGTGGSIAAYIGQRAHNLIKKFKEATSETFTPLLHRLGNDLDSAIEWSVLNETMRNLPGKYYLNEAKTALVMRGSPEELAQLAMDGIRTEVPIINPLVVDLVESHISANGKRIGSLKAIRSNEGLPDSRDAAAFYPIPRNPRDTPFFAFVIDDTVTGTGHSKMIYAKDGQTLEKMKNEILSDPEFQHLKILTKGESEAYFKAHGQFEFERSINENYINNALARKGKSSSFLPVTDPHKIVNDFLEWHLQRDANLVREAVSHRYSAQFDALRNYATPSTEAAASKFGYQSALAYAENAVNNPASNLIKLALDIQKTSEYPWFNSMNKLLDSKASEVWNEVSKLWKGATSPDHLEAINSSLTKAGYGGAYVTPALYEAMNGSVPRGALTAFVNKANSLLATFALRADPLNALNNAVGSSVLLGTETKALVRDIMAGNAEGAGELSKLIHIAAPGTNDLMLSPTKLIANSISRFHADKAGREFYKKYGFISSITEQYDQALDMLAIRAGDTQLSLEGKIADTMKFLKKAGDRAEGITGNRLAEEFNRYVAADVMKQITDVAVKHGIMDAQTQLTYINTFVNRTQGNYLASQRPIVFQGPIGQAIGLFQTYQFNLIQQLTRHIGEGNAKNALTMMGLQTTVYGMNGLPAFNAINTHIIGTASGNTEHRDLYDVTYGAAGKQAGDWLTYGGLSNALGLFHPDLKMNMYGRGDVNPRSLTILPTDPAKVPIVAATAKMFMNVKEGLQQVAMGADVWGTFLNAVEHNGVSRPLAGMAQVLEAAGRPDNKVVSTSNQGNILMAHDLMNLASGVRILGGKPMDEAIVQDAMFRRTAYTAADSSRKKVLAEGIKTSILNGDVPDQKQLDSFADSYAKIGGKQSEFAKFMAAQYRNVKVSQANQLASKLSSPYMSKVQELLGGYSLEDLSREQGE